MRLVQLFADPKALRAELDASVRPDRTGQALRTASGGGRLAGLLATLPEAEASLVLEELWTLAGIRPVGGRSAAEITHRIVLRATAAKSPGLTPAEADLIRRYLAISAPPRIALEQAESLAAEGGGDLSAAASHWTRRLTALVRAGTPEELMTLSTAFARPFGYYDGLFFEIRSSALGPEAPLAAGGRYDGLPARLGGQAGAVGCMVRPARAAFGGEA
jgi:ATP phosphoribosyltransferase regulatory subunit